MTKEQWNNINTRLSLKMKDYKLTSAEVIKICNISIAVLRKYVQEEYIVPITQGKYTYYTEEHCNKIRFIIDAYNFTRIDNATAAGIYDYFRSNNVRPQFEKIKEYAMSYWKEEPEDRKLKREKLYGDKARN